MPVRLTILFVGFVPFFAFADVHELEGDYLYKESTVRTASELLSDFLD